MLPSLLLHVTQGRVDAETRASRQRERREALVGADDLFSSLLATLTSPPFDLRRVAKAVRLCSASNYTFARCWHLRWFPLVVEMGWEEDDIAVPEDVVRRVRLHSVLWRRLEESPVGTMLRVVVRSMPHMDRFQAYLPDVPAYVDEHPLQHADTARLVDVREVWYTLRVLRSPDDTSSDAASGREWRPDADSVAIGQLLALVWGMHANTNHRTNIYTPTAGYLVAFALTSGPERAAGSNVPLDVIDDVAREWRPPATLLGVRARLSVESHSSPHRSGGIEWQYTFSRSDLLPRGP